MLRPHKTLQHPADTSINALQLTEGKYSGIIFSYGKVEFDEDPTRDALKLNFDYEIHRGEDLIEDKKEFEQELGDFLVELLEYGVQENNLVYAGGIDEDRKDYSE